MITNSLLKHLDKMKDTSNHLVLFTLILKDADRITEDRNIKSHKNTSHKCTIFHDAISYVWDIVLAQSAYTTLRFPYFYSFLEY